MHESAHQENCLIFTCTHFHSQQTISVIAINADTKDTTLVDTKHLNPLKPELVCINNISNSVATAKKITRRHYKDRLINAV